MEEIKRQHLLSSDPRQMQYTKVSFFKELIDVDKMQNLLDSFCQAIGVSSAIIDLEGNVIVGSNWQKICTHYHRVNADTCKRCIESDTVLANKMLETRKQSFYRCKNGLTDAAAPIILEGKHVANLFIGQFLLSEPDIKFFKKQSSDYGFDEKKYMDALKNVPIIKKSELIPIMSFLQHLAATIGEMTLSQKRMRESNRELEQFAYIASHDLQEPLRVVVSYLQFIETLYKEKLDDKGKNFISRAIGSASRMQSMIRSLLEYSQITTRGGNFRKVDMNSLVKEVLENIVTLVRGKKAEIIIDSLPQINVDKAQISRLFQNLIQNAIKFCDKEHPVIHISAFREKDGCRFSVQDNGIGVEEKYRKQIFNIFRRLHSRAEYEGTGIGLAICKRIVERHGGRIWVESNRDGGATFCFTTMKD